MIGEDKAWLVNMERGRNWNVPGHYARALTRLTRLMIEFTDWVEQTGESFIIVYPNDAVFQEMDPEWFERFPETSGAENVGGGALTTRSMWHLRAAARAKLDLSASWDLTLLTMNPTSYREFLAGRQAGDTPAMRQEWARAYSVNYRTLEMPA